MPHGFIRLTGLHSRDGALRLNVAHIVSIIAPVNSPQTLVTVASRDQDENDSYHVDETPEEIDALIAQAQGGFVTRAVA